MGIKSIFQNRQFSSIRIYGERRKWRFGEAPVGSVGLIVHLRDRSDLSLLAKVQALFVHKGAECFVCIFQNSLGFNLPEELMSEHVLVLNKKSVNWYGMIRPGHADAFLGQSFDLIINLSSAYFFTTSYIAMAANAVFRMGRYVSPLKAYNVVLGPASIGDEDAFVQLLERSFHFIKMQ